MLNKLSGLLCRHQENLVKKLQEENDELRKKLVAKQEHINKTNAYWKSRMVKKEVSKSL
jgi:hypothetical protein